MTPEADDLVKLARECGAHRPNKDPAASFMFTPKQLDAFASRIAAQKDAPQTAPVQQALREALIHYARIEESEGFFQSVAHKALSTPPASQAREPEPPFGSKRAAALALYKPPFQFVHGYIYDADHRMVADQDGFEGAVHEHVAARVRGWGRIGYLPDAAALQDEVGAVIADALTAFWMSAPPQADASKEGS